MPAAHPEFTVSSLTSALKRTIEGGFSKVIVEGEVSGWKRYPSGHCYFTLKDEGAQISAVMFAGQYESSCKRHPGLADGLKDGAKIKVFGNVTVYPPRGNYQIVVLSATLAGLGDLMQKYLELKAKLEGEGLFDPCAKAHAPLNAETHRNRHERGRRRDTRHVHRPDAQVPKSRNPPLPRTGARC